MPAQFKSGIRTRVHRGERLGQDITTIHQPDQEINDILNTIIKQLQSCVYSHSCQFSIKINAWNL